MKKIQFISRTFITAFIFQALNGNAQINLNSGLLAHYPLDGNSKSTAGVSGYDLTNYSATLTTDHYGNSNSAYSFNGSTYLQGSFAATGYSGITESAWINTTTTGNLNTLTITATPFGALYVNRFTSARFMGFFDGYSVNNSSSDQTTVSVENGWTFVTATNDGSTTRLYVNGVFNYSYSETLSNSIGNGAILIGDTYGGTSYLFRGSIDEVRVYTRALSAKEILALYQMPKAAFSSVNECAGVAMPFTDESDTIVAHNHYLWRFGDNTTDTSRNPKHKYAKAGTYQVWMIITSPAGSADSISQTVTVYPVPSADFKDSSIDGRLVVFSPTGSGISSYTWDFGDKTGSTSPTTFHTYNKIGTYNASLITENSNGCRDTVTKSITVFEIPQAKFSVASVCAGQPSVFKSSSLDTSLATYAWKFGDKTTSTQFAPSHTYSAGGIYPVTLIVSNPLGYADSLTQSVVVYGLPDAGFKATVSKTSVQFTPDDLSLNSYLWDFGDSSTSTAKQPSHTYNNYGTYKVTLTVKNANGCDSTYSQNINVAEAPVAGFTYSNVCQGASSYFIDSSQSKLQLTYFWNFGDQATSTLKDPAHVYTVPGTYSVKLKVTNSNGSSDSVTRQITIYPLPDAKFTAVVNGDKVYFTPSDSMLASYTWNFGDSSTSQLKKPVHLYAHKGNYTVSLWVANAHGCDTVSLQTIVILKSTAAKFGAGNVCLGSALHFTDSSQSDYPLTYKWDFGDHTFSSAPSPSHTYAATGTYNVILKVNNSVGEFDSISKQVRVFPVPSAKFGTLINDYKVSFTPQDTMSLSYNWDFGDSNSSTFKNPVHIYGYKNTFNVTLKTSNSFGCDSSYTQGIVVNETSGIMDMSVENPSFSIYPNPATSGIVKLTFHNVNGYCRLSIISIDGKVILHETLTNRSANAEKTIDISGWKPGVYAVKLETGNEVSVEEIIRQ